MRLIGILSWYDERADWLAATVASLAKAQVEHLIAVDGPYALYPDSRPSSASAQHDAIVETCRGAGMGLTLHIPDGPWAGNEVEKRTFCFQLAETIAEAYHDWYFICDADAYIVSAIGHTTRLEATDCDVAEILMSERYEDAAIHGSAPLRCIYRAINGLHLDGNHYTYRTPDGRDLNNGVPACDLRVEMEHRIRRDNSARRQAQLAYYERRDREAVEA